MVIIVYLEHLAVKHQTTSGISVLEKKKSIKYQHNSIKHPVLNERLSPNLKKIIRRKYLNIKNKTRDEIITSKLEKKKRITLHLKSIVVTLPFLYQH